MYICINIIWPFGVFTRRPACVCFVFFSLSLAARVDKQKEPKNRHLCEVDWRAFVDVYLHGYGVKDSVY